MVSLKDDPLGPQGESRGSTGSNHYGAWQKKNVPLSFHHPQCSTALTSISQKAPAVTKDCKNQSRAQLEAQRDFCELIKSDLIPILEEWFKRTFGTKLWERQQKSVLFHRSTFS